MIDEGASDSWPASSSAAAWLWEEVDEASDSWLASSSSSDSYSCKARSALERCEAVEGGAIVTLMRARDVLDAFPGEDPGGEEGDEVGRHSEWPVVRKRKRTMKVLLRYEAYVCRDKGRYGSHSSQCEGARSNYNGTKA